MLEIITIADEIADSDGVQDFFRSQASEFVFRFASESLMNFVKALMWPVYVVQIYPPWGAIALGAAFVLFPRTLKKPITRWLFDDANDGAS